MQRSRLFILIGLLLLLGVGALFLVVALPGLLGQGGPAAGATATPVASPTPETLIIVAAQDIARGETIPADKLTLAVWPKDSYDILFRDVTVYTDTAQVVGKVARIPIYRSQPVLGSMIAENVRDLGAGGSDAALQIPAGMVAIAVPVDAISGVANAPEDGDHVSVIGSFLIVDLDTDFQTLLPNVSSAVAGVNAEAFIPVAVSSAAAGSAPYLPFKGRIEADNALGLPFYNIPAEMQRPRLVTQLLIQNATVLHVGPFTGVSARAAAAEPTPTLAAAQATAAAGTPQPTATPPPPREQARIMTLVISPQDAVVLTWLLDQMKSADGTPDNAGSVHLTYVLCPAEIGCGTASTESVTLQYMIDRFSIALPAKLPYGPEPAVRDIAPAYVPTATPPPPPAP